MKIRNKYHYGNSSRERLDTVSRYIHLSARRMIVCSPVDVGVPWMGGRRIAKEQNDIYKARNSSCDGYEKKSYHQILDDEGKSMALDLVPYIPGKGFDYTAYGRFGIIGMLMLEAWEELQNAGIIPKNLYLHWGGLWTNREPSRLGWDMAHFEVREYEQIERIK